MPTVSTTAEPGYSPPLVLDSACGEEVCGRNKGNAVEGCNVKCTANQCMMRSEATQYNCEPVTPLMSQMFGHAGELHHALEACAALKVWISAVTQPSYPHLLPQPPQPQPQPQRQVETILGPLQHGLGAFKSGVQAAIVDLTAHGGTRETVGAALRAIAAQIAADATVAEKQAGRGDEKLRASVAEARRLGRVLTDALDGPVGVAIDAPPPVQGGDADGEADVELGPNTYTVANFHPGMAVRDAVLGLGRILEVGKAGGTNSGCVLIDYDDKSASHGQPEPRWRTVDAGARLIEPIAEELSGIRVVGGAVDEEDEPEDEL